MLVLIISFGLPSKNLSQISFCQAFWNGSLVTKYSHQISVPGISFTAGLIKILHSSDQVVCLMFNLGHIPVCAVESYFKAEFYYWYLWKSSTKLTYLNIYIPSHLMANVVSKDLTLRSKGRKSAHQYFCWQYYC